jgi:transglutaminase-like putative cysteine protease
MARTQGTSARTQRLIAGVATALVAAASAIALGRVFDGNGPTLRLLVAGLASAAIATALERRSLVLATIASAAGLAVAIAWLVFPETTWLGLPTPETLRATLDAAALVGEQARVEIAPAPALAPLMLAGVAGVWAAVFAAHSLAFRAGSPLLGLLPPVALVGFADSVLEDVIRPFFGLLFLIAALALLFADGLRRVQGWGPVWTGPGRRGRIDLAAGRGARRVAAAAVVVAAIAPIALPGFGSQGLVDLSTTDDDRVRVDPLVSVASSLQRDEPLPVMRVESAEARYWRLVALPTFDGQTWSPDPDPLTAPVEPGAELPASAPGPEQETETVEVTFTTESELALPWLPLPYPSTSTDATFDDMAWDPEGASIALADPVGAEVTYTATADVVRPTADQLREETIQPDGSTIPYTNMTGISPEIEEIARRWTQGAETAYDRIIAIQERFTGPGSGFSYSTEVPASTSDRAMVEFLEVTKTGFCQQFASSMAAMLRTLGIPARLAVGYTPGALDGPGERFAVTTENTHTWVEVRFPTYGWVPFEPTPNRQVEVIGAYPYLDPASVQPCPDGSRGCPDAEGGGPGGGGGSGAQGTSDSPSLAETREGTRPAEEIARGGRGSPGEVPIVGIANAAPAGPFTARNALLAGLVVVLIALALVPPFHAWQRRRRLRRAGHDPRAMILATYDVFADRAAELGYPRERGQTIEEYRRASASVGADALDRLSRLATDAAYAGRDPDRADADAAGKASDEIVHAMRRRAGWAQRLTGPYRRR